MHLFVDEIHLNISKYLTLADFPAYARLSKNFHRLAIEILKNETIYFGGNKLNYLKGLCVVIKSSSFPREMRVVNCKKSHSSKRARDEKIDFRATLEKIRTASLFDVYLLDHHLVTEDFDQFYSLIILSPIEDKPTILADRKATLLNKAAKRGYLYLVFRLLQAGTDPNIIIFGYNALHHSILHKQFEVCSLLLKDFADPNQRTKNNDSPLLLAARVNSLPIADALLTSGARDENQVSTHFPSALYYCIVKDLREMAVLIRSKINIATFRDRHGGTYLHMAMLFQQDWMLEGLNPEPFLNSQDRNLNTALHIAASHSYELGIRFLAHHHAVYNAHNLDGQTAFALCPPELQHLLNY